MSNPLVSVVVLTYNHEKYIEQCIRSIAAQKCDFPIEVWVGEDKSTDSTADVLRKLEPELPDYFQIIYRQINLNTNNGQDLIERCRGKYLAICEGDDYWLYDNKLQKQVDFLEAHKDYVACFHECEVVGEDSKPTGEIYPTCEGDEYTLKDYYYSLMPGQTASYMSYLDLFINEKAKFHTNQYYKSYPADRRNAFLLSANGRVAVVHEKWSAYRHVVSGGNSFSANVKINAEYAENEIGFGKTLVEYALRTKNQQAIDTAKATYFRFLLKWSFGKNKIKKISDTFKEIRSEDGGIKYIFYTLAWYFVMVYRRLRTRGKLL